MPDNAEGFVDIQFKVPDMPDDAPATDKQKAAIRALLEDAYDPSNLTMGQASLLLDVSTYINGVLHLAIKSGVLDVSSPGTETLFKLFGLEAVMKNERLWKDIHRWGRQQYSLGRATSLPELDPKSELFKSVFLAVTDHFKTK